MSPKTIRRTVVAALLTAVAGLLSASPVHAQTPSEGPGGPVLVVTDPGDRFGEYYAEILRAEGLNEFAVADVGSLSAQSLAAHQVVVLAQTGLSVAQAGLLQSWVQGGGNLIAMRPDPKLAGLLGLGSDVGDLPNGYLQVAPGRGITGEPMQFHDVADRWTVAGATTVATLYSSATAATSSPAVTLRSVGSAGGQAAAFTYDLARSVVYTRQGNPAWAGQERDSGIGGGQLIRSDDLFFGGAEPDWVDLDKVSIPQADEQQRLLANLVTQMSADRMPLPRFWYLPRGEKAAVVMTGDDHANGGTTGQFNRFEAASQRAARSPTGSASGPRRTSIRAPRSPAPKASRPTASRSRCTSAPAATNFTRASLAANWSDQLPSFRSAFPTLDAPATSRTHCIAWSDWASEPIVGLANGIRLDTNYYYWPEGWVNDRPGMFTGSGMPMRFADLDGSMIDVYQAATQLTDESGIDYAAHIKALIDGALGAQGYYGVFTANMHTDSSQHPGADAIVAEAEAARGAGGLRAADARVARRSQRLVLRRARVQRQPAGVLRPARRRRCTRAGGDAPGRRTHRRALEGHPRGDGDHDVRPHGQGHRVRGLRRRRRRLRSDVRHGAVRSRAARDDDHRVRGERELGARRLHVQRGRRAVRVPDGRRPVRSVHEPGGLHRPRRRSARTSGAGGRSGGRHRSDGLRAHVHRDVRHRPRRAAAAAGRRVGPAACDR